MTASSLAQGPSGVTRRGGSGFPANHPWDRNFFLLWAGLIWLGIVMGFGPEILQHAQGHGKPFPLIVHFHAAAFLGWLALFTGQILLIRTKRWDLHRKMGLAMVGLALVMMVLGPATALIADAIALAVMGSSQATFDNAPCALTWVTLWPAAVAIACSAPIW